ncbi:MAG TPA: glycosyltransferase family 39 protein [Firmicutes bacterium]|nr:glycosyltransferase family 39 protein [Bacillota bacterium]
MAFLLIFAVGCALRLILFSQLPGGLNQDEASIGYDAWSILHYGMDRNGIRLPVHLIAWGSGQNALYAYLSIPFIAVMGLNVASVRMVNLLFGLLSIPLVYLILNRTAGRRAAFIGMALTAISPWHIMLSRWGLESNLLPGLFLLTFYVFLVGLDRYPFLYLAAALAALCLYAYGAAYLVVPLFCIAATVFMLTKAKVPLEYVLVSGGVFVIIALPILLFILTNLFHWGNIQIYGLTAPEMTGVTRMATATGSHSLWDSICNFFNNVILQDDGTATNQIAGYGVMYLISLPFTAVGCLTLFRMRKEGDGRLFWLLTVWLVAACLLFFTYDQTNFNRVNILYPALLLLTALGLDSLCGDTKRIAAVGCCYLLLLTGFTVNYFGPYRDTISRAFFASFGDAIQAAEETAGPDDTVYVAARVNMPYIFALFYTQTPPAEYLETVEIQDMDAEFQKVNSFGHFVFDTSALSRQQPGVYIVDNSALSDYDGDGQVVSRFENYSVLQIEEENPA